MSCISERGGWTGSGKGAEVGAGSRPTGGSPALVSLKHVAGHAPRLGEARLRRQTHAASLAARKGKSRHSGCKQLLAPLRAGQAALPSVPTGPRVIAM